MSRSAVFRIARGSIWSMVLVLAAALTCICIGQNVTDVLEPMGSRTFIQFNAPPGTGHPI